VPSEPDCSINYGCLSRVHGQRTSKTRERRILHDSEKTSQVTLQDCLMEVPRETCLRFRTYSVNCLTLKVKRSPFPHGEDCGYPPGEKDWLVLGASSIVLGRLRSSYIVSQKKHAAGTEPPAACHFISTFRNPARYRYRVSAGADFVNAVRSVSSRSGDRLPIPGCGWLS
jgi:hypothetical protein